MDNTFHMQAPTFESKSTDRVALIDADFLKYLVVYDVSKELDRRKIDSQRILIEKIHERLDEIMPQVQCKARIYLWSGKTSDGFRLALCREKPYKGNRKSRDPLYPEMYDDMNFVEAYINEQSHNLKFKDLEADDIASALQNEHTFIYSKDKDLLNVSGLHWDININDWIIITKEKAWRSFMMQMITGDSGDAIPGIPGIGRVKAQALLESTTDGLLLPTVLSKYMETLGKEHGLDAFNENYLLLRLLFDRGKYFKEKYIDMFTLRDSLTRVKL